MYVWRCSHIDTMTLKENKVWTWKKTELMLLFLSLILDSSLVRFIVDVQGWFNTGVFKCK